LLKGLLKGGKAQSKKFSKQIRILKSSIKEYLYAVTNEEELFNNLKRETCEFLAQAEEMEAALKSVSSNKVAKMLTQVTERVRSLRSGLREVSVSVENLSEIADVLEALYVKEAVDLRKLVYSLEDLIMNGVNVEWEKNVELNFYDQRLAFLHKKMIIIDGKFVYAGSSNYGYKSLVTTSDPEVNFEVESEGFAREATTVWEADWRASQKVDNSAYISWVESVISVIHRRYFIDSYG